MLHLRARGFAPLTVVIYNALSFLNLLAMKYAESRTLQQSHKSFDVLGEYLEFGDLFDGHPLTGVL